MQRQAAPRCREYGEGSHAVVLAHGGRYDRASWRPQAASDCLYDAACLADDVLAAVRYLRRPGAATVSVVGRGRARSTASGSWRTCPPTRPKPCRAASCPS